MKSNKRYIVNSGTYYTAVNSHGLTAKPLEEEMIFLPEEVETYGRHIVRFKRANTIYEFNANAVRAVVTFL